LKLEFILAAASIIWLKVYDTLATPAVWPSKLHQPMIQDQIATCFDGTTYFVTKYIPPAVGYADTNSETAPYVNERLTSTVSSNKPDAAIQYAIIEPINQAHTTAAGPPKLNGMWNVAGTEPRIPSTEIAYEMVDQPEKCRFIS